MQRVSSQLKETGYPIIAAAALSLILLLAVLGIMRAHAQPKFGADILPAESNYLMGQYDRSNTYLITIAPGDEPRFYMQSQEVENGLEGISAKLDEWEGDSPARVKVIIMQDESIPIGVTQKLINIVLKRGFTCSLAARPEAP